MKQESLSYMDYAMRVILRGNDTFGEVTDPLEGAGFPPELMTQYGVEEEVQRSINRIVLRLSERGVRHVQVYRLWSYNQPQRTCWEALTKLMTKTAAMIPENVRAVLTDRFIYIRPTLQGSAFSADELLPYQQYAQKWTKQDDPLNTHGEDAGFFNMQLAIEPYLIVGGGIGYLVGRIPQGDRLRHAQEKLNEAIER